MPKVSQQYRDARRDQILAAARRSFLRDGFHATSMQDLFAEAGLSSGAVYSYFASKDDVIIAIAEENIRGVIETIHTAATQRPDTPIGAVIADAMDILRAEDARNGVGKLAVIVWAEALRNPSLAARFAEMVTRIRADLVEFVQDRQGSGDLPADVPAEALAGVFISMVPGYVLQLALLGSTAVDGIPAAVRALWPLSSQMIRPMARTMRSTSSNGLRWASGRAGGCHERLVASLEPGCQADHAEPLAARISCIRRAAHSHQHPAADHDSFRSRDGACRSGRAGRTTKRLPGRHGSHVGVAT